MEATAKDLRFYAGDLLERAHKGEEVVITYRGRPYARLVPYEQGLQELPESEAFGMWKDRNELHDVENWIRKQREGRF